jgi:hypothetical protein
MKPDVLCNPRVLIVTPEVTYLPDRMGGLATFFTAKAGGLADVSAALISALFEQGADVHVAMPDYRAIFSDRLAPVLKKEIKFRGKCPMTASISLRIGLFIISTGSTLFTDKKISNSRLRFSGRLSTTSYPMSSPT